MSVLLLALALAAADPLAECRRLDQSFDTKGMPPVCSAAVDDATRPTADRADAARLWAFALFTNGDVAGAETAFLRMFALLPSARLPDGASPRLQEVFTKAKARFDVEGAVGVDAKAAADDTGARVVFTVVVKDALRRVQRVRAVLSVNHVDVKEAALTEQSGTWSGAVDAPDAAADGCRVDAIGSDGTVVGSGACTAPAVVVVPEGEGPPWLWIGVGTGAVVVVAAVVVGGFLYAASQPTAPAAVTVRIE